MEKITTLDGKQVKLTMDGDAVEATYLDPVEEFFESLEKRWNVERTDFHGGAFFGRRGGGTDIVGRDGGGVMGIVDEHDVQVKAMWPAYDNGDDTELDMYICVEAA